MRAHRDEHEGDHAVRGARPDGRHSKPVEQRRREVALGAIAAAVFGAAGIGVWITSGPGDTSSIQSSERASSSQSDNADAARDAAGAANEPTAAGFVEFVDVELAGLADPDPDSAAGANTDQARDDGGCTIGALSLRLGASGEGVTCLQNALAAGGFFSATVDGEFRQSTHDAVVAFQEAEHLFVDGVVGRESAVVLNVWPDEESLVVRTPAPPDGAVDLWGVELSPVASAGDDAPPLPENSGSGYRVVYDRAGQRVWAVDGDERVIRSWLVSGSTTTNELPGTHTVYSRSEMSTAWNGKAYLPNMIRWLKTERGNIGFHGIPTKVTTGEVYQTTDELGTRLSGGCQRQHNVDAAFLWGFADVGTTVVVT